MRNKQADRGLQRKLRTGARLRCADYKATAREKRVHSLVAIEVSACRSSCSFDFNSSRFAFPDAQQKFLPGRQAFQLGIGKFVEHSRLSENQWLRNLRCGQQMIDDCDGAIVEMFARIAKLFILFLKRRIKARIERDERICGHGVRQLHVGLLARPFLGLRTRFPPMLSVIGNPVAVLIGTSCLCSTCFHSRPQIFWGSDCALIE